MTPRWLTLLGLLAFTTSARSAVFIYDEAIDGDLSDQYLLPVPFSPGIGTSTLQGSIASGDRDLFTLTVAAGMSLNSIRLLTYATDPESPENVSYLLSQPGSFLSAPPTDAFPDPIGYVGFGKWAEGRELIRFLTAGPPYDYASTLGPGSYAFWINETDTASTYQFAFTVAPLPVPEPSSLLFASTGIPLLFRRNRRPPSRNP